jgi:hypothetical protein
MLKRSYTTGGDSVDFQSYKRIMKYLWENGTSSDVLFGSLLFNVGTRGDNTAHATFSHFRRYDEFVTLCTPQHKVHRKSFCSINKRATVI